MKKRLDSLFARGTFLLLESSAPSSFIHRCKEKVEREKEGGKGEGEGGGACVIKAGRTGRGFSRVAHTT